MSLGTVVTIGWHAATILADGGSVGRVLAPVGASIYIVVGGDIVWLGGPTALMHPRAILLSAPPAAADCVAGDVMTIPPWLVRPWRPRPPIVDPGAAAALRRGARALAKTAASALGEPRGFGAWLLGTPLAFPLTGAGEAADAIAGACARDDAAAAAEAALPLLGLGAGLTPSGDDYVGGAFFARVALAQLGGTDTTTWRQASAIVRAAAGEATNPISATLLGDLLDGHGWSALHDLARALAAGDDPLAMHAATRLIGLGHSSGWDLLAGFVAGASS